MSAQPGNYTYRLRLSIAHAHRGHVLTAQGQTVEAIAAYTRAEDLLDELAVRDSANRAWQREVAIGQMNLGKALTGGDHAEAERRLQRAVSIMETLTAGDPTNVGWRLDLAAGRRTLAQALLAKGDTDGAAREAEAALQLIARAGGEVTAFGTASTAHAVLAEVWTARGDPAAPWRPGNGPMKPSRRKPPARWITASWSRSQWRCFTWGARRRRLPSSRN